MNNYIVFLRGINVSGKNILKMQHLKDVLRTNNFPDTQTYIQSGNLFIASTLLNSAEIKKTIGNILLKEFQIETVCIVKTPHQLQTILDDVPFSSENTKQWYFTFTEQQPSNNSIKLISSQDYKGDTFSVADNCIYIECINGYGKTKLTNNFLEKKLSLKATTRNYNTLTKMISFSKKD